MNTIPTCYGCGNEFKTGDKFAQPVWIIGIGETIWHEHCREIHVAEKQGARAGAAKAADI